MTESQAAELLALMTAIADDLSVVRFVVSAVGLGVGYIAGQLMWAGIVTAKNDRSFW